MPVKEVSLLVEEQRRVAVLSKPVFNRRQTAHALASLGYPISRYGQSGRLPEKLLRIFSRARQAYYQNRREFESLQILLESQLNGLNGSVLRKMTALATPFVPMWLGAVQGSKVVQSLH